MIDFFIVIPTYNSEKYLDGCLSSVLGQEGDFNLHVHIQDKLSEDSTLYIAARWKHLIDNSGISLFNNKKITYDSEGDKGIYDAVGKAIGKYVDNKDTIITWLGSDDLLTTCSLSTVADIFCKFSNISWITGICQLIDENGNLYNPHICKSYSRFNLLCGNYDGRKIEFVQQEGTFWRSSLYFSVNGLNRDYEYAGDYDLWLKFAQKATLHTVDFQLANFRSRKNQVSSNSDKYYEEIDTISSENIFLSNSDNLNSDIFKSYVLQRYSQDISWEISKKNQKVFCSDINKIIQIENIKIRLMLFCWFIINLLSNKVFFVSHSSRKFIIRFLFFHLSLKK